MFKATDGLFHFVFANQNDDYYTSEYLKMSFVPYLRYNLLESGYRYIFLFQKSKKGFEEYVLQYVGSLSDDLLNNEPKKKKFLAWNYKQTKEKPEHNYNVKQDEINRNVLEEKLKKLFNLMLKKDSIAVVIPLEIFYEFGIQNDFCQKLEQLKKAGRKNVIILTTTVDSAENDKFFKKISLEYLSKPDEFSEPNIFFDSSLFPEIKEAFTQKMPSRILTYEVLREVLRNRMQIWNDLSYKKIYLATKYYFMRNMEINNMGKMEDYAKVIWCWFNDNEFKDMYYNINFSDNSYHMISVIMSNLDRNEVRNRIEDIIENGTYFINDSITEDSKLYEKSYICDNSNHSYIVTYLKEYRSILRTHKDIFNEEEISTILSIITEFEKPSYLYHKNAKKPAYCLFDEPENRKIIDKFFNTLKNKSEWNNWEKGAVYILYTLFELCNLDAHRPCDKDSFHTVHTSIFKKSMEALQFCMNNSLKKPYENEEAIKFTNDIIEIFRTEDYQKIRFFSI